MCLISLAYFSLFFAKMYLLIVLRILSSPKKVIELRLFYSSKWYP